MILAGSAVGVLIGLVNGAIIAFLQLPPIIVTLATLSIVRGSALILGGTDQHLIRDEPAYTFIGAGSAPRPAVLDLPVRARRRW